MSHQYFENVEQLRNQLKEIEFDYFGQKIKFITNVGVFSKSNIDYGTQVLLRSIELSQPKLKVLDVGCGYGVIGIAVASRYKDATIDMIDINKRAVELAKINIALNHIKNASVIESNLYVNVTTKYNVIVTNPPIRAGKQVVYAIFEGALNNLEVDGELYVVIQKKQGAPSAMKKMEELFQNVEVVNRDAGYYILKSTRIR